MFSAPQGAVRNLTLLFYHAAARFERTRMKGNGGLICIFIVKNVQKTLQKFGDLTIKVVLSRQMPAFLQNTVMDKRPRMRYYKANAAAHAEKRRSVR